MDTNSAPPEQTTSPSQIVRLRTLLRGVPGTECHLILDRWDAAVLDGTVRAVPHTGQTFRKIVCGLDGTETEREIQDELILPDETFNAWFEEQRTEARYAVLAHVGTISTDEKRLASGEDDFQRLYEARVKRLAAAQAQPKRRGRRPRA